MPTLPRGTAAVVDDQRLAERLCQRRLQQPHRHVGGAARRERHDDVDRPRWVIVGARGAGGKQKAERSTRATSNSPLSRRSSWSCLRGGLHVVRVERQLHRRLALGRKIERLGQHQIAVRFFHRRRRQSAGRARLG